MFRRIATVSLCALAWSGGVTAGAVAVLAAQQDPPPPAEPPPPTPPKDGEEHLSPRELARRAAKDIKAAIAAGVRDDILAVYRSQGLIDDRDVARALGDAVDSEDEVVRWATVLTLRYNPNHAAVSELRAALRVPAIQASEPLTAEVLLAIGQHADERMLPLLTEGFGPAKEPEALTDARIDAVGRLQNRDAIDALIKFGRSGFAKGHEERICRALQAQTCEDLGTELRPWVLWWNQGKKTWRLPEPIPAPPADWAAQWEPPTPERLFDRIPGYGRAIQVDRPDPDRERGRGRGRPPGGGGAPEGRRPPGGSG
ncbi:MAG: hypothetical protein IPM29_18285 [Planctomycetes bacterium]|nr:hypothetical protein [Planctomycetota bacterium]